MFKKYLLLLQLRFRGISRSFDIAKAFHFGDEVEKDLEIAEFYYKAAIEEGEVLAHGFIAHLLSEKGNEADSYYHLGRYCELTDGEDEAVKIYKRAAGYASMEATHKLATRLSQTSEREALSYYRYATTQAYRPAMEEFVEWGKNNAQASFCLGQMHHYGELNSPVDLAQAWTFYRQVLTLCNYDQSVSLVSQALSGLRAICTSLGGSEWLKLSFIYKSAFDDYASAIDCAVQAINSQTVTVLSAFAEVNNYYGHLIGLAYEQNNADNAFENAWKFYLISASKGVSESLPKLKEMALVVDEASHWFELGNVYKKLQQDSEAVDCFNYSYHLDKNQSALDELLTYINKNIDYAYICGSWHEGIEDYETALFFHNVAAQSKHEKALLAIRGICETTPSDSLWLLLGGLYIQPFEDNLTALECFKKASSDNLGAIGQIKSLVSSDSVCAFRMGREAEEQNTDEELLKAWNYYLIAARLNNEKGLLALERISSHVSQIDNKIVVGLEIGKIYQHVVQDNLNALSWYLLAADSNNADLNNALQDLAQRDAECTYRIGLHYLDKGDKDKAFTYFINAINQDNEDAASHLTRLANEGDAQAQFYLGVHYHHARGYYHNAVDRCIQASAQYEPALNYLMTTTFSVDLYIHIGKKYEEGEGVDEDLKLAYFFYKKAERLNDKYAAFYLAQLLELEELNSVTDDKPIPYLFTAVMRGCSEALPMLNRLTEDADAPTKKRLGDLYNQRQFSFFDPRAAAFWHEKASEENRSSLNASYS
jgi:TPR repeat protein